MNVYINKIFNLILAAFFLLSIILPKVYSNTKLVLLLILFATALIFIFQNKNDHINKNILTWYMLFIGYHLIWICVGLLYSNNTEALIDTFRLFVIYPLIFLVFTVAIARTNKIKLLFKVIIIGNFIIAIYTILIFIDSITSAINLDFLYNFSFSIGRGVHEGYSKVGGENITSLFFTFPFVLFNYANVRNKNKLIAIISIVITIIAILLSGRRMLQLIAVLAILIFLFLQIKSNKNKFSYQKVIKMIFGISVGGIISYYAVGLFDNYFSFRTLSQRITMAFKPSSDNVRYEQIVELLKEFTNNPILGVGFGEGITSIVRSIERPWSYEVTYAVTLYQTGILGFIIFVTLLCYNIFFLWKLKRRYPNDTYVTPLLYGYISFLIACFSNPLLGSFDFMWVLYIIPMYYNFLVMNNKNKNMTYKFISR